MTQVFEALRTEHPEQMQKIVAVAGDVTLPGFGLSSSDLQLILDNVSIVFNSAATVKFDEELKTAVQLNVKGPRELLAICRNMKQLQVGSTYAIYKRTVTQRLALVCPSSRE